MARGLIMRDELEPLPRFAKLLERGEVSFDFTIRAGEALLGRDLLAVLKAVESSGTLRRASEVLGAGYSAAWRVLSDSELALGVKLVRRTAGGYGGGGAFLTPHGALVLGRLEYILRRINSLRKVLATPDLRIYGSDCPGVRLVVDDLWERGLGSVYSAVGSWNGLELLSEGLCEVSGLHIPNPDGEGYNTFILRDERFKGRLVLVRGYVRRVGFVVRKGNPKSIRSFRDLARPGIVLANRNRGSGTRSFVDDQLKRLAAQEGIPVKRLLSSVRGYRSEHPSHTAVAHAVASGRADVGVALEWAAKLFDLDFVPLREEHYDFAVLRSALTSRGVREFLEALGSSNVRKGLESLGFTVPSDIGSVLHGKQA